MVMLNPSHNLAGQKNFLLPYLLPLLDSCSANFFWRERMEVDFQATFSPVLKHSSHKRVSKIKKKSPTLREKKITLWTKVMLDHVIIALVIALVTSHQWLFVMLPAQDWSRKGVAVNISLIDTCHLVNLLNKDFCLQIIRSNLWLWSKWTGQRVKVSGELSMTDRTRDTLAAAAGPGELPGSQVRCRKTCPCESKK